MSRHAIRNLSGVWLVGFILTGSACSTESGSENQVPPKKITSNIETMMELEVSCFQKKASPLNDAYDREVPGIHPALLTISKLPNHSALSRDDELYDRKWLLDYSGDPKRVQILFCVERIDGKPASKNCKSPLGKEVPVYDATYRVRAIEARTGMQLKEWRKEAKFTSCPTDVDWSLGQLDKHYTDIPKEELRSALEEIILPQGR
ncbi:hypothetical protein ACFV0B_24460 [Streptomyces xanthophaeus]|uniref:hypothetical protein n=1 Tax=Streptomyces xanthophaeus TaxID=67385 RepID=UPI00369F6BBB